MDFVIAELIRSHKQSSWAALENGIKAANRFRPQKSPITGKVQRNTIDRRKLQDLAEEKPGTPLTRNELELLDSYLLEKDGVGLAEIPIFRRQENLFHSLTRPERVSFFLGVRWINKLNTDFISRWDVRALNAMKDRMPHVETETFEVITRNAGRSLRSSEWQSLRNNTTGSVLVSIGSPVASASTEYLLAEIFSVTPFRTRSAPLPVGFIHPDTETKSPFMLQTGDIEGVQAANAALIIDGKPYISRLEGTDFGVVVGKRVSPDHALFVIAGTGGPGTFAAAEHFASGQIGLPLPDYEDQDNQPVLITLLTTQFRRTNMDRRVDHRTITSISQVCPPMIFRYGPGSRSWEQGNL